MTPTEQIERMILELAELYGRDLMRGTVRRYVQALEGISSERIGRAIDAWVQISHFFPQPDELLEMNARLGLTPEEQECARQKLLARIDWNPPQLKTLTEAFLEELPGTTEPKDVQAAIDHMAREKAFVVTPLSREDFEKRMALLREQAVELQKATAQKPNTPETES